MSLISEALRRAQKNKADKAEDRPESVTVDGLFRSDVVLPGLNRRSDAKKARWLVGLLSISVFIALGYLVHFLGKPPVRSIQTARVEAVNVRSVKSQEILPVTMPLESRVTKEQKTLPSSGEKIPATAAAHKAPKMPQNESQPVKGANESAEKGSISSGSFLTARAAKKSGAGRYGAEKPDAHADPVPKTSRIDIQSVKEKRDGAAPARISEQKAENDGGRINTETADYSESAKEHNNSGVMAYLRGDYAKAVEYFTSAIQVNPDYSEVFVNLGIVYKKQNKLHDAMTAYKKAIALDPTAPEAYYNLGILFDDDGDYKRASSAYRQFLQFATDRYQAQKQKVRERLTLIEKN
ncbi:MAG: tetratricopeptide repeat protein [Pseudomonadota bacterium]